MLFTGNFADINQENIRKNKIEEVWVIVRSLKNGLPNCPVPIYHVPDLSPSYNLFKDYLMWRDNGQWNIDKFKTEYRPRFLREMGETKAKSMLEKLYLEIKTKNILIVCFCPDEAMCHRSLVSQVIAAMGYLYVVVAGSRTFNDYCAMCKYLDYFLCNYGSKVVIVSGGAQGADSLAERYADEKGLKKKIFPAQWDVYGKSAGYRRNEQMQQWIANFPNRGCVCFWDGVSKGTAHNFDLCEKYNNPLRIVRF